MLPGKGVGLDAGVERGHRAQCCREGVLVPLVLVPPVALQVSPHVDVDVIDVGNEGHEFLAEEKAGRDGFADAVCLGVPLHRDANYARYVQHQRKDIVKRSAILGKKYTGCVYAGHGLQVVWWARKYDGTGACYADA
ncbi:MAG: hypothetical protein CL678_00800 [Bdellovibrionaceae bacterium]|nr:hypothetical protein [Pseudobdellovibrionaceae bacterium]